MKIYVAGPMSNREHFNYPAFDLNAQWLRDAGYDAVSPAEISRAAGFDEYQPAEQFTDAHYHETMLRNYTALLRCDAIAFMPGWETSKGARLERDLADRIGLPMYRVDATRDYFERELIIGIGGYARSGKDTLVNLLVRHLGFERRAFADALRSTLYGANPYIKTAEGHVLRLQEIIDEIGWDKAKVIHPEVRGVMVRFATEGARDNIDYDLWVNAALNKPHTARLAISDVRFRNESDAIHRRGGYVIQINREGVDRPSDHPSEALDINPDWVVTNNTTPEEMFEEVREILDNLPEARRGHLLVGATGS